jgi:16S rRNA (cytosine967-C5)-methyltransferase
LLSDQNPRQIAARILSQRQTSGEFTENLLETALASARLSPADRGLCHELVCGVVRWLATLDCLIARKTDPARQQRPALVNLLRLGLYQIFWLDRIPPHAAVHETVELAKQAGHGSQAGFINAVLRSYLREAVAIKKILADMKRSQPALGWSHPEWLVEKWRRQFGEEKTRELLAWNNLPPKTYARVNALKLDDGTGAPTPAGRDAPQAPATAKMKEAGDLLTRWREENVEFELFERDWTGGNMVFELKTHPSLARLGSFQNGWFYVQDPSTLLAPMLLDPQPGETILDLCAAPGGKTTLLAQRIHNQGSIVASDADLNRLKLVRDNCIRLGVTCVEFDNNLPSPDDGRKYERILVDAPCSNTGVMRRRVDLRWRIQPAELKRLSATQLELLHQAATRLAAGGVLVYSTCSLEAEENSERVRQFLEEQPGFRLETARQLLPFTDGVDGAYVARLKHVG